MGIVEIIARRDELVRKGHALPDGSFAIEHTDDLAEAIAAIEFASDEETARAHIIRRARELGASGLLPAEWRPEMSETATSDHELSGHVRSSLLTDVRMKPVTAAVTITIGETEGETEGGEAAVPWSSEVAFENWATSDGRYMLGDSLDWREPPLSLMAMIETTHGGHLGAQVAGKMEAFQKLPSTLGDGVVVIVSDGTFSTEEYGAMIGRMVENEELTGISVDLSIDEWCFRDPETGELIEPEDMTDEQWEKAWYGEYQFAVRLGTILAATICPTPAFAEAKIAITAAGEYEVYPNVWRAADGSMRTTLIASLTVQRGEITASASAPPAAPPRHFLERTEFPGITPLTVFDQDPETGLYPVAGHLADWTTCHVGIPGTCTRAPRSPSNYAYFHVGEVETAEGDRLPIGKIMLGTKHAGLQASRMEATQHYDDNGQVGVIGRASDGEHGIWFSGYAKPGISEGHLEELRQNPPSGDWRNVNGALELVAACCVPVPGFPIPRAEASVTASADQLVITSLIASSGVIVPETKVREALIAAGCGCEGSWADEALDELADLAEA